MRHEEIVPLVDAQVLPRRLRRHLLRVWVHVKLELTQLELLPKLLVEAGRHKVRLPLVVHCHTAQLLDREVDGEAPVRVLQADVQVGDNDLQVP